jgi:hypothetical protein
LEIAKRRGVLAFKEPGNFFVGLFETENSLSQKEPRKKLVDELLHTVPLENVNLKII